MRMTEIDSTGGFGLEEFVCVCVFMRRPLFALRRLCNYYPGILGILQRYVL